MHCYQVLIMSWSLRVQNDFSLPTSAGIGMYQNACTFGGNWYMVEPGALRLAIRFLPRSAVLADFLAVVGMHDQFIVSPVRSDVSEFVLLEEEAEGSPFHCCGGFISNS